MQITSKKHISHRKKRKVKGTDKIKTLKDLEREVRAALTADICSDLVNLAYSENGEFDGDVFIDADTFWEVHENDDVKDMTLKFFNGEDLDSKGPANPTRDYFRFNGYDNIESTNDPAEIYLDELDIELVDYVIDHVEDGLEFPETIQKLIDNYLENVED